MSNLGLLPGETLTSVWLRRLVSIPLFVALFLISAVSLPIWLPLLLVWDALTTSLQKPRTRCGLFLFYYLFSEVWGILAAGLVWAVYSSSVPERYQAQNYRLQGVWASAIFFGAKRLFNVEVEIEGGELVQRAPYLLLIRHTSLADTVLAATFIAYPNRIGLRYVLKKELLWDPCLDIVGRRLPNHFVDRSGSNREREIESVKTLAQNLRPNEGVLIYPEGTRFSEHKKKRALEKLRERGEHELADRAQDWSYVLPPRPGGVLALLEAAPDLDVVILTHTGFEGAARWKDFWGGSLIGKTLKLKFTRHSADEDKDVDWLFERWSEVAVWVEEQYEH